MRHIAVMRWNGQGYVEKYAAFDSAEDAQAFVSKRADRYPGCFAATCPAENAPV